MNNISKILFTATIALPSWAFSAINSVYDAKLKMQQIKDAISNSPLYGMALYSGSAIFVFIAAIIVIFILIMLLKK